jgi:hypothetical protein
MLTQRSWWLAALLAATAVVGAAPEPSEAADLRVYYPRGYEIAKGGGGYQQAASLFTSFRIARTPHQAQSRRAVVMTLTFLAPPQQLNRARLATLMGMVGE